VLPWGRKRAGAQRLRLAEDHVIDVSDRELLAFAQGELDPEAHERIEQRLDESPGDRELVAKLAQLFGDEDATMDSQAADTSPGAGATSELDPARPRAGARLGRYLVIEELGFGGMGLVLRAYDPKLQREVALKCMRPGLLSSELQARLGREAQAMAKLNHRNVVSIYDVELLEQGLVIVMEYVEGTHLGRWLLEAGGPRPLPEVLAMFVAAGEGLLAAHAAGLLHRDFKPSNVLISKRGEAKVTDFGIAAIDGSHGSLPPSLASVGPGSLDADPLVDGGRLTEIGQVMGTPLYMPPEQLSGEPLSPAADQYAFCVSLWQGLCGTPPFTPPGGQGLGDLLLSKVEGPPRWPAVAAGVPRRFVDAIARGLHPDPAARWPSMTELLAELRSDPRARRRRIASAAVVLLGLAGGVGGWAWARARAEAACEAEGATIDTLWDAARADTIAAALHSTGLPYADDTWARAHPRIDAFAASWRAARTQACRGGEVEHTLTPRALAQARACLDEQRGFLRRFVQVLAAPDGTVVAEAALAVWSLPVAEACLDSTELERYAAELDDPRAQARAQAVRERLADARALRQTGRFAEALAVDQEALDEALALESPPLVAAVRIDEGDSLVELGRYHEAEATLEAAYRSAALAGDDAHMQRAASLLVFTVGNRLARPYDAARWAWLAAIARDRRHLPGSHPDVAAGLNNEAAVEWAQGKWHEARAHFEEALVLREAVLGPEHPEVATVLGNLGGVELELGDHRAARDHLERALAIETAAFGPDHPKLAKSLGNLGNVLLVAGDHAQALASHQRALAILDATLPPDHPDTARTLGNVGNVYAQLGRHEEALAAHQRTLAIFERTISPEHPDHVATLNNLATALQALGRYDEALEVQARSLAILERKEGAEQADVAMALNNLGSIHIERGAPDDALPVLRRALTIWERELGPDHPYVAAALLNLGVVHLARGEPSEALAMDQRALALWEASLEPQHPYPTSARLQIGLDLLALGRAREAVAPLERALADRQSSSQPLAALGEARFALARALWDGDGDRTRAAALAWQALDDRRALEPRPPRALHGVREWIERNDVPRPSPPP
jgi:eukaryotic-like serine/threonine-protein kinase